MSIIYWNDNTNRIKCSILNTFQNNKTVLITSFWFFSFFFSMELLVFLHEYSSFSLYLCFNVHIKINEIRKNHLWFVRIFTDSNLNASNNLISFIFEWYFVSCHRLKCIMTQLFAWLIWYSAVAIAQTDPIGQYLLKSKIVSWLSLTNL